MFQEVSCVIPGASRVEQLKQNLHASEIPGLNAEQMQRVREIYDEHVRPVVHQRW
jgi:aryl-alcohol dehydrogenase-like predicted oxidoreductase